MGQEQKQKGKQKGKLISTIQEEFYAIEGYT